MKYISDEELMDIYKTELGIDPMVNILYLIEYRCKDLNPWLTMDEFYKLNFEGLCWVCYENKFVYEGTYSKKDNYFYHEFETTFDYEDVTHVQPIYKPEAPA